jgi:hypothetical protein
MSMISFDEQMWMLAVIGVGLLYGILASVLGKKENE